MLRPRIAVPIHWGTYRRIGLSRDPLVLREPAEHFARFAAELMPEVEVRVLPVGGSLDIGVSNAAARSLERTMTRTSRGPLLRRIALGAVGVGLVVATFVYFLPTIANYGEVWAVVKTLSWPWICGSARCDGASTSSRSRRRG